MAEHDSGYEDPGSKSELPVMQGKFKQDFQATIPAVLDDVWEVVQEFGDSCEKWWLESTFLGFDGDDSKQHIGCVRNLSRGDELVKDKLLFVSPDDYKLMFETIETVPNKLALENCSYLISLEPGHKEPDDETEILITANYDCLSVLKPRVETFLKSNIEESLKKLKEEFVKPQGQIEVTVLNAEGIGLESTTHVDAYCSICVDNNCTVVETSVVRDTVNPRWNETFKFDFYSTSSVVNVALWNRNLTSATESENTKLNDELLGIVNFALPSFSKTTETKFKVPISSGYIFMKMRTCDGSQIKSKKIPKQVISREIEKFRDNLVAIYLKPPSLRPEHFQWKTHRRIKSMPAIETENLPGFCENVPAGEKVDHSKFGTLITEIAQCVNSFRSQIVGDKSKSRIESLYSKLPNSPEPAFSLFDDDNHFCMQFFVGFAPNFVTCVHDISDIPTSIQQFYFDKELQDMIKAREVFAVSLDKFAASECMANESTKQRLLLIFTGNQEKLFEILGIAIGKRHETALTPKCDNGQMKRAKMQLMHSLEVNHLYFNVLLRNLYLDSINYSMHENLPPNHPVRKLLALYFGEMSHKASFLRTIFINNSPNLADIIFPDGSVRGVALLVENCRNIEMVEKYLDFKKDFLNRGFDFVCPKYLFQHDILRLYDVLMNLVSNYFIKTYQIDREIESDEKLQRFFSALIDRKKGNVNLTSGGVNTRSALTKFCTNAIFAATVMTSAFEKTLFNYCCLTAGFSTKLKDQSVNNQGLVMNESIFDLSFPANNELLLQVLLVKLLSIPNAESFGEQSSLLGNKVREKFVKFSTEVKERNSSLRENDPKLCYKALDPFEIPANSSL